MTRSSFLAAVDEIFYTQLDELFPDDECSFVVTQNDLQPLPSFTAGARINDRPQPTRKPRRIPSERPGSDGTR